MTKIREPLVSALAALVERATQILDADAAALLLFEAPDDWERDPSDSKVFRRRNSTSRHLHPRAEQNLRASDEWSAARNVLISDPILGKVIDQLVGTVAGRMRVDGDGLLMGAVHAAMWSPDPSAAVKSTVARWRADYGSDTVTSTTIGIIDGLETNDDVVLSGSVSLRPMTDREIALALRIRAMPVVTTYGSMAVVPSQSCAAVVSRQSQLIGPIEAQPSGEDPYTSAHLSVEAVLVTLRLVGFQRVRLSAQLTEILNGGVTWSVGSAGPSAGVTEPLDETLADRCREFYLLVRAALSGSTRLAIAVRRFSASHEEREAADALLDLWIGMEAVFGPDDGTEISFRLAQTAANFAKLDGYSRAQVFQWIKKSYRVRSQIAHGREPRAADMKRLDGSNAALDLVVQDLRFVLREGLLKALRQGLPDSNGPALTVD